MGLWGALLTLGFLSANVSAKVGFSSGLMEIRPGVKRYVEHRPAQPGKTTIYFANGLTWDTRDWKALIAALDVVEPGLGIVAYDMKGMGKTLLIDPPVRETIYLDEQVRDLEDLFAKLNVRGPTAIVGLSYGGGLALRNFAKNPNMFDKVIPIAPLIHRVTAQDKMIKEWLKWNKMNPWDWRSEEEMYNDWLHWLVYTTYPVAEPVILENPYKLEAVYRMVLGAKDFLAKDFIGQMIAGRVHLIGSIDDKFVIDEELREFWLALTGKGSSYIRLTNTGHKSASERPMLLALWIKEILNNNPELSKGLTFLGDAIKGEARSGNVVIPLKKVNACETLLRRAPGAI